MSRPMMTMLKALLLAAMIALAAAAGPRRALLETYDDAEEDAAAELGNPDEAVEVASHAQVRKNVFIRRLLCCATPDRGARVLHGQGGAVDR